MQKTTCRFTWSTFVPSWTIRLANAMLNTKGKRLKQFFFGVVLLMNFMKKFPHFLLYFTHFIFVLHIKKASLTLDTVIFVSIWNYFSTYHILLKLYFTNISNWKLVLNENLIFFFLAFNYGNNFTNQESHCFL